MNSLELKDRQSVLMTRCKEIVETCKKEIREMTEDEQKEFDQNKEEIKSLRAELDELQKKLDSYENELPSEEGNDCDDNQERQYNNNTNKTMETRKFNLVAELRSAYETGKKINLNERAYTVADEGEDVVVTDVFDIWEPLRAKNVLIEAGAQYIPGIKNNVQIPIMGAVSCNWASETGEAQDGSAAFSKKTLSPKRITAKYPISLELLAQDTIGVEAAIRADIIKAVNAKLEATLLGDAKGDSTKPAGLFYGQDLVVVDSFEDVTDFEAEVENANIYGDCKYVLSPSAKAAFRSMIKGTNGTGMVMEAGAIDGTQALATSHVANKRVIYGDFSNLVIATLDNVTIDVVRDVASLANGQVTIVVNAFVDAALIREDALVYGTTEEEEESSSASASDSE